MIRPGLIVAASAACLLVGFSAIAAAPIAPRGAKVLAALDTNKDGFVDHGEFRVGQDMLFQRVDANHDGAISREEFNAVAQRIRGKRAAANPPADPAQAQAKAAKAADRANRLFGRIDTNKDGVISHAEYLAAGDALFTRCDKDHDGKLTPGECSTRQAKVQPKR